MQMQFIGWFSIYSFPTYCTYFRLQIVIFLKGDKSGLLKYQLISSVNHKFIYCFYPAPESNLTKFLNP